MKQEEVIQQNKVMIEINNHVKSQLNYHSLSIGEIQKVHYQQILPSINRLLSTDVYKNVVSLFNDNGDETVGQQLLHLFSSLGEIGKIKGGYYLPLPIRLVTLPASKKNILLSSTIKSQSELPYLGIASGYEENSYSQLTLTLDQWLPSIDINEFTEIINNTQPFEINEDPSNVFIAKEKRGWVNFDSINEKYFVHTNFISRFQVSQGSALYYWVKRSKKKKLFYKIPNEYLDIAKLALEYHEGIIREVEISSIDNRFSSVRFHHRIPRIEQLKLMLFAFPENFYNPFKWIIPKMHVADVENIIKRLGMKSKYLKN
jgi:hypothetical protein